MLSFIIKLAAVTVGARVIGNGLSGRPLLAGDEKRETLKRLDLTQEEKNAMFISWAFGIDYDRNENIVNIWNQRHGDKFQLDPSDDFQYNLKQMIDCWMHCKGLVACE